MDFAQQPICDYVFSRKKYKEEEMPEGEVQGKMSYPLTAFVAAAAAGSGKL